MAASLESFMSASGVVQFPCKFDDLPTPCCVVDMDVVERNCRAMTKRATTAGVELRPHVKTHKVPEIAALQIGDKTKGIVASTLAEVRFFAAHGYSDITYSVPISASKLADVQAVQGAEVTVFIDSEEQVDEIERFFAASADKKAFPAFLKLDSGYHRAGIDITNLRTEALTLATRLHTSNAIAFRGVYSHSGHAYDGKTIEINEQECAAARDFADQLIGGGVPVPIVSVGGTPTCATNTKFEGATEIHPGNYVFFDRQQMAVGGCGEEDVACTVLARVVGHYRTSGHMLCDAGSLAMSKDKAPQDNAFGKVLGEGLLLSSVSQEVGKLVGLDGLPPDFEAYPLGALVRILPNHSCLTAALHPHYFMVRGGVVVGVTRPCRGW
mmetsp:Transcript_41832/g.81791  ORF Transcript_41832/g.81791 Transcript_41832/m.81791 type:complete len:383 (-) Transcript_41832:272-1420(-)